LLREGRAGNLSRRIKGSSAEEVQARSHPRLLRWPGRAASSRDSCLRELPGDGRGGFPKPAEPRSRVPGTPLTAV
ncbi:unnamed protein product, partial [Tetraodon nigroviridis]